MSLRSTVDDQRSILVAHPYELNASDFVRFRSEPNDDVVAGVVRSVTALGASACREFRRALGDAQIDTLRTFAMRRTLQGRRLASSTSAIEALDAFALLPRLNDVPWESWLKATLFVARSNAGDLDLMGQRFVDVASDDAIARFDVAFNAMGRLQDLTQCHLVEVSTNHGVGFVEILVFSGASTIGFLSAPSKLGHNEIEFNPSTNLAQLAVTLSDALDATKRYVTTPLGHDQLAATSFSLTMAGSYLPTRGCLSFVADGVDGRSSFTTYVAELFDDDDAATLADEARATDEQSAVFEGQRLIVFSPQPNFEDDDADGGGVSSVVDFHEAEDLARAALSGPTPPSWLTR